MGFKWSMVQLVLFLSWALQYCTFGSVVIWYLLASCLAVATVLAITTYDHDYWASRGVFAPPAWPLVGHIKTVVTFKEQGGMCFKRIYDTYKNERFLGVHQFYQRTFVVRDPELIKRICVHDFQHFVDRGFFFNKNVDPLAGSVLFLRGHEWRKLRAKISPIFSPNKLRGMFPLIEDTANEFVIRVRALINKSKTNAEINFMNYDIHNKVNRRNDSNNNITTNTDSNNKINTNDDINNRISKHNGINNKININNDSNNKKYNSDNDGNNNIKTNNHNTKVSINDNNNNITNNDSNNNPERAVLIDSEKLVGGYTADAIVPCAFGLKSNVMDNEKDPFAVALHAFYEMSWFNIFEKTMRQFWPAFVLFFRMRIIPKKTHDFFFNIVTSVLRARENGAQEKRGDFIDMMMSLRDDKSTKTSDDNDVEITDMVISANAFIIFLGGFETTSSTLAFLLLELAANPEVQEKMRAEIIQVLARHGGEVTYEVLQELTYMEMVIQETLRLYPPFPSIQRMCTKDYVIPGTRVTIERGTIVLFPTLGIQRDEQYFEKAGEFVPQRWAEGRPAPPPGVYMPFGDGPRYCIGKRFALIQMKCCLVRLLQVVRVHAAERRARTEPFSADPRSPLTLHPADSRVRISLL